MHAVLVHDEDAATKASKKATRLTNVELEPTEYHVKILHEKRRG